MSIEETTRVVAQNDLPVPHAEVELPQGYICDCWECSVCGRYTTEPYCFVETILCDSCAEAIANHYNYRHSQRWLTWSNPRREPESYARRREISASTRRRIFERDAYRCRYCGAHRNLTIDHVMPVISGGTDADDNLVTCCKSCNSRKRDHRLDDVGMILSEPPTTGEES